MQMEGINCTICCLEFNDVTIIPRILSCGHSFCSPCLREMINTNPVCRSCRQSIPGSWTKYTINFSLIELVKSINSNVKEKKVSKRFQEVKNKFSAKEDILLKDLKEVRKALTQIETGQIEGMAVADFETIYDGLGNQTSDYSNLKAGVCLHFDNFHNPRNYITKIHKILREGDSLYTVAKVQDRIRYGRISIKGCKVIVHALDRPKIPVRGKTVWFDDFKKCFVDSTRPRAFLKIKCPADEMEHLLYITFLTSPPDRFLLELCTGESGPSYKGCLFTTEWTHDEEPLLHLNVDFLNEKVKYGDGLLPTSVTSQPGEYLLENFSAGNFDIVYHEEEDYCNAIGKVTSSSDLDEIEMDNDWTIIDCGFLFL